MYNLDPLMLFERMDPEAQKDIFSKLIGIRLDVPTRTRRELTTRTQSEPKDPTSNLLWWTQEDLDKLLSLRQEGLGPTGISGGNYFPGRTKSAISNKLKELYASYPELKDAEMSRRARVQFEDKEEEIDIPAAQGFGVKVK